MGAQLERALANFMLDLHVQEHGYTEVLTSCTGKPRKHDRHRTVTQIRR